MVSIYLFASSPYEGLPVNVHFVYETFRQKKSDVYFIEPIGLRSPRLSVSDFRKVFSRIRPRKAANPSVVRTRVLPVGWNVDRFNSRLLVRQLPAGTEAISWFFLPSFAPILPFLKGPKAYMAVDLYAGNPGVNSRQVTAWEKQMVAAADLLVATSKPIQEHLEAMVQLLKIKKSVVHLPNGADVGLFQSGNPQGVLQQPAVVMWGNITPYKVDVPLMSEVIRSCPEVHFYFLGPEPTGDTASVSLPKLPNVHRFVRRFSQSELANLAQEARALILCPPLNLASRGSLPMKLMEYFSTQKPVILRATQATSPYQEAALGVNSVREMIQAIRHVVANGPVPDPSLGLSLANQFGFEQRRKRLWDLQNELENISKN